MRMRRKYEKVGVCERCSNRVVTFDWPEDNDSSEVETMSLRKGIERNHEDDKDQDVTRRESCGNARRISCASGSLYNTDETAESGEEDLESEQRKGRKRRMPDHAEDLHVAKQLTTTRRTRVRRRG